MVCQCGREYDTYIGLTVAVLLDRKSDGGDHRQLGADLDGVAVDLEGLEGITLILSLIRSCTLVGAQFVILVDLEENRVGLGCSDSYEMLGILRQQMPGIVLVVDVYLSVRGRHCGRGMAKRID